MSGGIDSARNLLLVNYEMSRKSQVFSHQLETAELLSKSFSSTTVISGKVEDGLALDGVEIISSLWVEGQNLRNSFRFLRKALPVLARKKDLVVFSHMTNIQSMLLLPFTKLFRVKHFLWYAHASNHWSLKFLGRFLDGVLTSTPGSCPLNGARVYYIGQSVDPSKFKFKERTKIPIAKFVHVGRFDPSKKIDEILSFFMGYRDKNPFASIEIIGSPSSSSLGGYQQAILNQYASCDSWVKFTPAVHRETLPGRLLEFDCFVHAFQGSLDKTLIEATLSGIPVISLNSEYERIFGSWGELGNSLQNQVEYVNQLEPGKLHTELARRRTLASDEHSLEAWISKTSSILKN
jgi:glycosyltransferase involved in cell wall biosynthesis